MKRQIRAKQLALEFRTWGGARKGAGRKPKGDEAGIPHRVRPEHKKRFPVQATLRVCDDVYSLRSRRSFRAIERGIYKAKPNFQVSKYSIQGNHIHLIVEADDKQALMRGLKGLAVSAAKRLNREMGRRGQVIADRYHARVLRTPGEVRNSIRYLENNARHHCLERANIGGGQRDPYVGAPHAARTWLLGQELRSG